MDEHVYPLTQLLRWIDNRYHPPGWIWAVVGTLIVVGQFKSKTPPKSKAALFPEGGTGAEPRAGLRPVSGPAASNTGDPLTKPLTVTQPGGRSPTDPATVDGVTSQWAHVPAIGSATADDHRPPGRGHTGADGLGARTMGAQPCVDHDRNLAFKRPADWTIAIEPTVPGGADLLTVWSPASPATDVGMMVVVVLHWYAEADLDAFVDGCLASQASSDGYVVVGRTAGRHPTSGLPAVSAACDFNLDGDRQRKEFMFLGVAPGLAIWATALCPLADRHLWRDGCKLISRSLRLADPQRPPVRGTGGQVGVGLPPGCSEPMRKLWALFDNTAGWLVRGMGEVTNEQTGQTLRALMTLGPAAHFEAHVFLLCELLVIMRGLRHPAPAFDRIYRACTYAIAGRYPTVPVPPDGPLARQAERERTYALVGDGVSPDALRQRMLVYAELVTTSGKGTVPSKVDPAATHARRSEFTQDKAAALDVCVRTSLAFRFSCARLFNGTPDIDALPAAEVDRRFTASVAEAAAISAKLSS